MPDNNQEVTIANGRFRLDYKIATGGFSQVFVGTDKSTGNEVAIKLEEVDDDNPIRLQTVKQEGQLYSELPRVGGPPRLLWTGRTRGGFYDALVTELLGPSLRNLWVYCDKAFGLNTVYLVAIQALKRLEALHMRKIIHNDIKPSNFVFGSGTNGDKMYLIDYGLAKRFQDIKDMEHADALFAGTKHYGNAESLTGRTRSYRDDLESLGLTLVQLAIGSLPWDDMGDTSAIVDEMNNNPPDILCAGLPELEFLMRHARGLRFDQRPNYRILQRMFEKAHFNLGREKSKIFQWVHRRYARMQEMAERKRAAEAPNRRKRDEDSAEDQEDEPPRRRRRRRRER